MKWLSMNCTAAVTLLSTFLVWLINIDCMAVEDAVAWNIYEHSEQYGILNQSPVDNVDPIRNGSAEVYIKM